MASCTVRTTCVTSCSTASACGCLAASLNSAIGRSEYPGVLPGGDCVCRAGVGGERVRQLPAVVAEFRCSALRAASRRCSCCSACTSRNRQIFIWGFLFPIPAWVFAIFFVGLRFCCSTIRNNPNDNVAYTAHIGGALFALVYYKAGCRLGNWLPSRLKLPKLGRRPPLRVHQSDRGCRRNRGRGRPHPAQNPRTWPRQPHASGTTYLGRGQPRVSEAATLGLYFRAAIYDHCRHRFNRHGGFSHWSVRSKRGATWCVASCGTP